MPRLNWLIVPVITILLLIGCYVWSSPVAAFGRHICWPIPPTIRKIRCQSNDWLGINPAPVVLISFTASTNDLATIIRKNAFMPAEPIHFRWLRRRFGPPFSTVNSESVLYYRHANRRSEYMHIDPSGTNTCYLLTGL